MKTSYILMIVTVFAKLFGLLREKAIAYFFGASILSEALLVALQVTMTFTNVISGVSANGFIPIYEEISSKNGEENANDFTSNVVNIITICFVIISILLIIFSRPLVRAMATGFLDETFEVALTLTRFALVSVVATGVFSIFKAYLQIKRRFIVSVCHAIVMNVILIVAMGISKNLGINYLGIGILVAFVFQYVIFLPYIKKSGYRYNFKFNFKDENVIKLIKIIVPVLISTSVIELNFIISKSLASSLFQGALSYVNFAYKLQSFVTGIVVTSIVTAIYPQMSRLGAKKDVMGLKKSVSDSLITMSILVIPSSIGLLLFATPIVELLFVGGEFTKNDGIMTATVLSFYALGVIGIGIREILSRAFYAIFDTKTPVINSCIMVFINVILSFLLMKELGIKGLALATTISFIVGAILLIFSLKNKIGKFIDKKSIIEILKILIASIVMGITSKLVYSSIFGIVGFKIGLILSIMVAGIVYLTALLILKVGELKGILNKILKKNMES